MALLLLRVGLDVIFIYNGYPKVFGRRLEHIDEMVHIKHLPACFVCIAGVLELCAKDDFSNVGKPWKPGQNTDALRRVSLKPIDYLESGSIGGKTYGSKQKHYKWREHSCTFAKVCGQGAPQ
jgi:hypothetical protein